MIQTGPVNDGGHTKNVLVQTDPCNKYIKSSEHSGRTYVRANKHAELHFVEVASVQVYDTIPECTRGIISEYSDVLLENLANGLPQPRAVQFEFEIKPDAVPISLTPYVCPRQN